MTNSMDATLKAIFGKFRASFTRRNDQEVLESPPDPPLALSGGRAGQISTGTVTGEAADLIARCNENARLAREKAEREASSGKPLALPESNVVRLPIVWAESVRGVPNGMLRSALFGAIKKGPRRYMNREEIAAQDGIQIFYTGQRLDHSSFAFEIKGAPF